MTLYAKERNAAILLDQTLLAPNCNEGVDIKSNKNAEKELIHGMPSKLYLDLNKYRNSIEDDRPLDTDHSVSVTVDVAKE